MPREQAFAVCHLQGADWQVMLETPRLNGTPAGANKTRFIANGMIIAAAVSRGEKIGEETAREIDEALSTLVRKVGQCTAERMKASADPARRTGTN